jgi:hypothetical protein
MIGQNARCWAEQINLNELKYLLGRGSRIRTCDLKFPKLPRYRAALYPVAPMSRGITAGLVEQGAPQPDFSKSENILTLSPFPNILRRLAGLGP